MSLLCDAFHAQSIRFISVPYVRWLEYITLQQKHRKDFLLLNNKCRNKPCHKYVERVLTPEPRSRVMAYFHIYWSRWKILFHALVEEGCFTFLHMARESKTWYPFYLWWFSIRNDVTWLPKGSIPQSSKYFAFLLCNAISVQVISTSLPFSGLKLYTWLKLTNRTI